MEMTTWRKLGLTGLLVYTASLEGSFTGVLGPTLPALQCLFGTDLKTISIIFFVFGMMNALGSVLGCFLLSKLELHLVMAAATTIALASQCVFPFLDSVYSAIVMSAITALCIGVLFNSRIFRADDLWPHQPFAVHLVIAGFALGPIIASLVAAPFLHEQESPPNTTIPITEDGSLCPNETHRVQYVYVILASSGVPLSIIMFVLYTFFRQRSPSYSTIFESRSTGDSYNNRRGYTLFLVFFYLLCMPAGGIFVTYGNLLSTYGVNSAMNISTSYMALITALFWGAFVTGRIVMTVISIFIRQIWIIIVCYIGLFSASVMLIVFGRESETWLASVTAFFGFFCAPFSALSFSWAREHIQLTGFVIALGSVGEYTGAMVGPYVGGVLIGTYGSDAFLYVVLGIVTYQFSIFCCFYFIGKYVLDKRVDERIQLLQTNVNDSSSNSD
ncbi:sodium-dependent glucose transporter 1-like [Haliotis rufescens]|uniref:sodium-dependent glucose transporter 1-like n=1 Tax=Haliotis rufescens TaxID=6454 RepID=UPI00201F5517|nr:sodium-dependent glucose transporter 1-like [Haliotis rufescens]